MLTGSVNYRQRHSKSTGSGKAEEQTSLHLKPWEASGTDSTFGHEGEQGLEGDCWLKSLFTKQWDAQIPSPALHKRELVPPCPHPQMIGGLFWKEDKTGLGNTRPAEAKSTWWGIGGLTEIPPTFLAHSIPKILEFSVRLSKQETKILLWGICSAWEKRPKDTDLGVSHGNVWWPSKHAPVYMAPTLMFSPPLMPRSKQPRITGHMRQGLGMKGDSRTDKQKKITWE